MSGSSFKFWDVAVNGCNVTVSFGCIGTGGQEQTKEFADATAARWHADKQIAEKLRKGYLGATPA